MSDKSDERKAVPREPTEAMLVASWRSSHGGDGGVTHELAAGVWRSMFDAAPVLATAPAEPPKEEIAMSSGTLREAARWLDTGKGRRPDGCTLRCIADVIDRFEPHPSGEVAALIEQLETIQPGFDGCVTGHALAQKAAAMLKRLNPTLPDTLPGQCPRCGEFARLSAPVPAREWMAEAHRVIDAAVDYYHQPYTLTDNNLQNAVRAYLNGAMPAHARDY